MFNIQMKKMLLKCFFTNSFASKETFLVSEEGPTLAQHTLTLVTSGGDFHSRSADGFNLL